MSIFGIGKLCNWKDQGQLRRMRHLSPRELLVLREIHLTGQTTQGAGVEKIIVAEGARSAFGVGVWPLGGLWLAASDELAIACTV
jgi:hypothetical protein